MDNSLYNVDVTCPVCGNRTAVTKVRSSALKALTRDSDFCIHYANVNPLFYEAWVCEECGYAAFADKIDAINEREKKTVAQEIGKKWKKRSFLGERTLETATEACKLVLYNLELRKTKSSEYARVCMRLAWLYRFSGDEREKDFLAHALKFYSDTYEHETFPADKLDEVTCMYLIGELNNRLSNKDEAVKWFSRLIQSPEAKKKPFIIQSAREQFDYLRHGTREM